jgi:FtsZ-binding cell division protein ZapB
MEEKLPDRICVFKSNPHYIQRMKEEERLRNETQDERKRRHQHERLKEKREKVREKEDARQNRLRFLIQASEKV